MITASIIILSRQKIAQKKAPDLKDWIQWERILEYPFLKKQKILYL